MVYASRITKQMEDPLVWKISFEQGGNVMNHVINEHIKLLTDFRVLEMSIIKDGVLVEKRDCNGLSMIGYGRLIHEIIRTYINYERG